MSTIVAVATGSARSAGVGIVRMSGEAALSIAKSVFRVKGREPDLFPNRMTLGKIPADNMTEQAFCVYFKAPFSYTGEDVIEFHCHGGKAVLQSVVALLTDRGAVPAARGEFTKRAFLNGKITLDGAEGVLEMIEAESRAELSQASRMLNGALRKDIEKIAETLLTAAANLEVSLDYPDETEEDMRKETAGLLTGAKRELEKTAASARLGRLVKEGAAVAIVGKPNAGKSSLLNAMLKEDRAIVTEIPGTTRDTLEGRTEIAGVKVTLIDTAGLRETSDAVERLGVERAKKAEETADLVLYVADLGDGDAPPAKNARTVLVGNKADLAARNRGDSSSPQAPSLAATPLPSVAEKADRPKVAGRETPAKPDDLADRNPPARGAAGDSRNVLKNEERSEISESENCAENCAETDARYDVLVSAKTGEGIETLFETIAARLDLEAAEHASLLTNERHRAAVETALRATESALSGYETNTIDCILVDVKAAYKALAEITGADVSESVVDRIFESFCVGK